MSQPRKASLGTLDHGAAQQARAASTTKEPACTEHVSSLMETKAERSSGSALFAQVKVEGLTEERAAACVNLV